MRPALELRPRQLLWAHPEWWSVLLAAAAWGALALHAARPHGPHHHPSFPSELLSWCLMALAMMLPLTLGPLRWVAFQSFRHRRHRSALLFLAGFLAPWMLAGVGAAWLGTLALGRHPAVGPGVFALAGLWALAPARGRALMAGHRTAPLAPSGWRADRDCLRYGAGIGASCVVTCGALMLACALTGHSPLAMLAGTALGVLERRSFRPPVALTCAGALLLAVWFLVWG